MYGPKVLVTGGAGFIGSHLVDSLLAQDYQVVVLDNCSLGNKICIKSLQKIQFYRGDVRSLPIVLKAAKGCDAIIHLAAVVGVDQVIHRQSETIETETIGTQNIIQAAKQNPIKKIIYSSSSAVYGKVNGRSNSETAPLSLVSAYAVAKRLNEQYLNALTMEKGISTNSLRFFNVYGGRQDERMVIPRFIQQAIKNQPLEVFGNGQQTRDFTYIDEVVKSISMLLPKNDVNGIFNIAREEEISIQKLAEMVKEVTKSNSSILNLDFPTQRLSFKVDRRVGCADKLFQHIGFKPRINLKEGLVRYFSHWQKMDSGQTLQF